LECVDVVPAGKSRSCAACVKGRARCEPGEDASGAVAAALEKLGEDFQRTVREEGERTRRVLVESLFGVLVGLDSSKFFNAQNPKASRKLMTQLFHQGSVAAAELYWKSAPQVKIAQEKAKARLEARATRGGRASVRGDSAYVTEDEEEGEEAEEEEEEEPAAGPSSRKSGGQPPKKKSKRKHGDQ
jgi:hypothetical protein